jgi:hypothetical protein
MRKPAFLGKYRRYPAQYVDPTVSADARAATLTLVPADKE